MRQHVIAPLGGVGPVLAERGDRGVDDIGLDLPEVVVTQTEPLERAHAEVLGHDVRAFHKLLEELHALRGLQLQRDRKLVPVTVLRGRHALLDPAALALDAERHALASPIARLDLDHPGAQVGQQHRAEGHGDDLPQVEHGDVAQRFFHGL